MIAPTPEKSSGGCPDHELEYPKGLSEAERAAARKQLAAFPGDLAQQLLDELAGRIEAGAIRVTPLAYLRGMIDRACRGTFTPEAAIRVSDRRTRHWQNEIAFSAGTASATWWPARAGCAVR